MNFDDAIKRVLMHEGGLWFGMSIVSGVSAVVGYALNYFKH